MSSNGSPTQSRLESLTLAIIERERQALGLSQTQLAGRTNISQSQYNQLTSGRKVMRWWQFMELCGALGLSAPDVIAEAQSDLDRETAAAEESAD